MLSGKIIYTHARRPSVKFGVLRTLNLPAVQEIQVRSLGQEDPLEKDMAAHSSILA